MRVLYDSTTPARSIPSGAQMVAGYTSGAWPTFPLVCQRWPDAVHVSIAINAAHDAMVLDVERGDADPADAPGWCQRQRGRGQIPTVYCNTSTWPSVQAACHLAGVPLPLWWRADYNGRPALEMGEVAHQYRSDTAQNLDYSVVADYWPGVDPPKPTKEDLVNIVVGPDGTLHTIGVTPNGHPLHFSKAPNTAPNAGWSVIDITDAIAAANPGVPLYTVQP